MAIISFNQQQKFISAFNELSNADKISKKPLNYVSKIISRIEKVENSHDIISVIRGMGKDTVEIEGKIKSLIQKLEGQKSGMHEKKQAALNNISKGAMLYSSNIDYLDVKKKIANLEPSFEGSMRERRVLSKKIDAAENKVVSLQKDLTKMQIKLEKTGDAEFAEADGKLRESIKTEISSTNIKIKELEGKINDYRNFLKKQVMELALPKMVPHIEKAKSGGIYDPTDKGFGPTTWEQKICSDKYAMKHFGSDLDFGRRQYVEIKVPNNRGRAWQHAVREYIKEPKLNSMKIELRDLTKTLDNLNERFNLPQKEQLENHIKEKKHAISLLSTKLESYKKTLSSLNNEVSACEGMKEDLHKEVEKLSPYLGKGIREELHKEFEKLSPHLKNQSKR